MKLPLLLCCLSVLLVQLPTCYGWCFDFWSNDQLKTRRTCERSAVNQSPIDIDLDKTIDVRENSVLSWINYDNKPKKMTLTNNGNSIQVTTEWKKKEDTPYLTGGPLQRDRYTFEQLHFHWSTSDSTGSEHTVNGESYSMEMHMVHWKTKYGSLLEAVKYKDGILVVGSFYNVTKKQSRSLRNIFDSVPSAIKINSTVTMDPFCLSELDVVDVKKNYVLYSGSLTGPQCFEAVSWIVGLSVYPVSKSQMEVLRSIEMSEVDGRNNREVQPLNGREVYYVATNKRSRT